MIRSAYHSVHSAQHIIGVPSSLPRQLQKTSFFLPFFARASDLPFWESDFVFSLRLSWFSVVALRERRWEFSDLSRFDGCWDGFVVEGRVLIVVFAVVKHTLADFHLVTKIRNSDKFFHTPWGTWLRVTRSDLRIPLIAKWNKVALAQAVEVD